jgi:hypothetical protein
MMKELITSFVTEKIKDIEFSINSKVMTRIDFLENNANSHNTHLENLEERFGIERAKAEKSEVIVRTMHEVIEKVDEKVTKNSHLLDDTKLMLLNTIGNTLF